MKNSKWLALLLVFVLVSALMPSAPPSASAGSFKLAFPLWGSEASPRE